MDSPGRPIRVAFDHASGWARIQQSLVRMLAPLTIEQLGLRSSPAMWSVGTLAAHMVVGRARWWHLWLGEGDDSIAALLSLDAGERTAAEIAAAHRLTADLIAGCLGRWTDADLEAEFGNPAQPDRGLRSRRWIAWHVLEHDLFHAGELSQVLGMHGLPGLEISDRRAPG